MVGVTITGGDIISDIHDMNDKSLSGDVPQFVTDLELVGMPKEEYLEMIKQMRTDRRFNAKQKYDSEPTLLERAEIFQKWLVEEGMWMDEFDIYDILPEHDNHGIPQFDILFGTESRSYSIGTEEESDAAFYENQENLLDDIGYIVGYQHFWEQHLDIDAIKDKYGVDFDTIHDDPEGWGVEKTIYPGAEEKLKKLRAEEQVVSQKYKDAESGSKEEDHWYSEDERISNEIEEFEDQDSDHWYYDDDEINKVVSNHNTNEIENDPVGFLEERGLIHKSTIRYGNGEHWEWNGGDNSVYNSNTQESAADVMEMMVKV